MFSDFKPVDYEDDKVFNFSESNSLRIPTQESFAAFNGFPITASDVFAIQTKKRFEKAEGLAPLAVSLKKFTKDESNVENETESELLVSEKLKKNTIYYVVQGTVQATKKSTKL